jgi:hypothetical protein
VTTIYALSASTRDLINAPRKCAALLTNLPHWYAICSSLDVIGDTDLAIDSYRAGKLGTSEGAKYLAVYGLLQALAVQQTATFGLAKALGIPETRAQYPGLKSINDVRNDAIGHPTNREGGQSFHFITRATLGPQAFHLLSVDRLGRRSFRTVSVARMLEDQIDGICALLQRIIGALEREEADHREAFRMEKLTALFPTTLSYHFGKLKEAIGAADDGLGAVGIVELGVITDTITRVREAIARRGLEEAWNLQYTYADLKYPVGQLEEYFQARKNRQSPGLDPRAAQIFAWYLEQRVQNLRQTAGEIDLQYAEAGAGSSRRATQRRPGPTKRKSRRR